jgi:hypothetical protein
LSASGEAVKIPSKIRAGDTVAWKDDPTVDVFGAPIDSSTHDLTYYVRFNRNNHGATVVGVADGSGWRLTISSAVSGGFHEDDIGYWQAVATANVGGAKTTLGSGSFEVDPNFAYVGTPAAVDARSQAQKDLDACQAAIRTLMSGGAVQEYRIGTRSLKRYDLAELLALESRLKAEVAREQKAAMIANGLGNPHSLFVRFGR